MSSAPGNSVSLTKNGEPSGSTSIVVEAPGSPVPVVVSSNSPRSPVNSNGPAQT